MSPGLRLLRRVLLLPVGPALERERLARAAALDMAAAEERLLAARDALIRSAADLADLFDDLLGTARG